MKVKPFGTIPGGIAGLLQLGADEGDLRRGALSDEVHCIVLSLHAFLDELGKDERRELLGGLAERIIDERRIDFRPAEAMGFDDEVLLLQRIGSTIACAVELDREQVTIRVHANLGFHVRDVGYRASLFSPAGRVATCRSTETCIRLQAAWRRGSGRANGTYVKSAERADRTFARHLFPYSNARAADSSDS